MSAKVTICIPTYNRAEFLSEAIESVLNQTFTDLQILVCDNASTDNTTEVVKRFPDPRVLYHRNDENIGIGANHRLGAEMATSEWVGFLSDDDLFRSSHITNAFSALEKHPHAAYHTCAIEMFGNDASGIRYPAALKNVTQPISYYAPSQAVQFLGLENPGFLNTIICRKSAFNTNLFWGKKDFVHMDVLVMTQLMAQGGFVFSTDPTVRYRSHATNISSRPNNSHYTLRLACMISYAVRYLTQFLIDNNLASALDIEKHGFTTPILSCVRTLVFGLGSFDASPPLRTIAKNIFDFRKDLDYFDSKFGIALRLARKMGFWIVPAAEKLTQRVVRWQP